MERIVYPIKIAKQSGLETAENLLKKQPLQIGLSENLLTTFPTNSYVVLDFGMEMSGGVRILTYASSPAKVRIRFGESLSECFSEIGDKQNATNDHALRDFTTELVNYSDMTFGNTGYRFVRIDVVDGSALIKSIVGTNRMLSVKSIWKYNGDDKEIKTIYEVAKRTVDLCAGSDYVWDGVKRDRLVWIGDMHPEMLALTTMYGGLTKFERSLDFVKDQTPLPNWMNNYPMYSMWWIIIIADYYKITSKRAYAEKQIEYMQKLLEQMNSCVAEDGELRYPAYFVDWPTSNLPDEKQGVRALNIITCNKAIEFLERFGLDTSIARKMLSKLLKQEIVVQTQKQVLGLKYLAVGLNEEDKQKLVKGGAQGMSTFMSYYILKAVASFDKQKAIEMMKEYYGAMLQKGATTFWEDFDISWSENTNTLTELPKNGEKDIHGDFGGFCYQGFRHSFCHGWSAGVIAFIKEECN